MSTKNDLIELSEEELLQVCGGHEDGVKPKTPAAAPKPAPRAKGPKKKPLWD
jgi:hypothetical protein